MEIGLNVFSVSFSGAQQTLWFSEYTRYLHSMLSCFFAVESSVGVSSFEKL
jgi:hypothetical protein